MPSASTRTEITLEYDENHPAEWPVWHAFPGTLTPDGYPLSQPSYRKCILPGKDPVMTCHAPAAEAELPRIPAPAAEIYDVTKVLPLGHLRITLLQEISLRLIHGEIVAILGPSGSGTSTFHDLQRQHIRSGQL